MKIGCKKSVVEGNFKKLLVKIVNLIFKYILSRYLVECNWSCYSCAAKVIICSSGANMWPLWIRSYS